jgi:glycosyltransferase involved in cell wall biosynthesis
MTMDLSVVVPIKDERDNLKPLHDRLRRALDPLPLTYEMLFVDDGSTDGSLAVLEGLAPQLDHLDARVLGRQAFQHRQGPVGAAVVHEKHLIGQRERVQGPAQPVV